MKRAIIATRWLSASLFAMALWAGTVVAQTGRIEGKVYADDREEPLAGVMVVVRPSNRSGITDAHGAFRITGVPAGEGVVLARYLGRESQQVSVTMPAGGLVQIDFSLKQAVFRLSDIVVSASREEERKMEIPVAIGVVDGGALRAAQPSHPAEIMNRMAGVWINVTQGEGHMAAIRQPISTDPVYLYLEDGIPARSTGFFNHNALYEINVPQADRIEVTKGPATALYGSDAIGGVINVSTRAPSARPQVGLSLDGGAYKWGRALATASNSWGGTGLRADVNLTRSDGWRRATDYDRQSGTVRWDQQVGTGSRLKTVATASRIDQQTAGSSAVSVSDYLNNPTINYTPISVREVKAVRISTAFEQEGSAHQFSFTPYVRYDWMRVIPNWTLTYDPQDYTTQNKSVGALIKYRRDLSLLRTRLVVGTDVDFSPGGQHENVIVPVRTGSVFTSYTAGQQTYDYDVTFNGVSPYVQAELSPIARLRINAGLRWDHTGYDYTNNLGLLTTGRWRRPADTTLSYHHVSPKIGVTYEFAEGFNVFASVRHGFRAPSQGQLFRQGSAVNTVALQPIKVNDYEAGIRGRVASRLDYDVTIYSLIKTNDVLSYVRTDGSTEPVNAGRTSHRGIETAVGVQMVPGLRLDVSYSYAKHRYDEWQPRFNVDLSGNEIQSAPRHIGNAVITIAPVQLKGARLCFEASRIGSYWMDQENTHKYSGHNLFNLRGSTPLVAGLSLSGRIMNLTNKRYAEMSSYTVARGEEFAPGMPRRVYLTVQYDFH
ncbi:MAG: TonB-dependent receptor [Gemmatimonadetes bacterium]|nr:TonB-dependent receptor [Gemmatimonadota bacterium]